MCLLWRTRRPEPPPPPDPEQTRAGQSNEYPERTPEGRRTAHHRVAVATGSGRAPAGTRAGLGPARPVVPGPQDRRPGGPALGAPPPGRRARRAAPHLRRDRRRRQCGVRPDPHRRGRRAPDRHPARGSGSRGRRRGRRAAAAHSCAPAAGAHPQGDAAPGPSYAPRRRAAHAAVVAADRPRRRGRHGHRRRRADRRRRLLERGERGLRDPDDSAGDLRAARRLRRRPRAGPRVGLPLRGRRARRDRRRCLHRVPGVLHRRHRLLPPRPRRPDPHRPRRALLQRPDGAGTRARVRRHRERAAAAHRAGAAGPDGAAAHPGRAVRRLLHPLRPRRGPRPLRPRRAGAAQPAPRPPRGPPRHRAPAPRPAVRDRVGGARRAAAGGRGRVVRLGDAAARRAWSGRHRSCSSSSSTWPGTGGTGPRCSCPSSRSA